MASAIPRVYLDACIFLNVIREEDGLWPASLKMLLAAQRGDIKIIASTLLLAELWGHRGDTDSDSRDVIVETYLQNLAVEWVEVDLFVVRESRKLSAEHRLRGADSVHLATAVRRKANYFVSRDLDFPYGKTVGENTEVTEPDVLWNPTLQDHEVDFRAGRNT